MDAGSFLKKICIDARVNATLRTLVETGEVYHVGGETCFCFAATLVGGQVHMRSFEHYLNQFEGEEWKLALDVNARWRAALARQGLAIKYVGHKGCYDTTGTCKRV